VVLLAIALPLVLATSLLAQALIWTRQFGTPEREGAHAVAADGAGNVYAAGTTNGALPGQAAVGNFDAFVRKYDPDGRELWTRQFGTPGSDNAGGVAADRAGNVYVAGETFGTLPGQTGAGADDLRHQAGRRRRDPDGLYLDADRRRQRTAVRCGRGGAGGSGAYGGVVHRRRPRGRG